MNHPNLNHNFFEWKKAFIYYLKPKTVMCLFLKGCFIITIVAGCKSLKKLKEYKMLSIF